MEDRPSRVISQRWSPPAVPAPPAVHAARPTGWRTAFGSRGGSPTGIAAKCSTIGPTSFRRVVVLPPSLVGDSIGSVDSKTMVG